MTVRLPDTDFCHIVDFLVRIVALPQLRDLVLSVRKLLVEKKLKCRNRNK